MRYNLKTLKNKLRILTVPIKDAQTVTVMVLVAAGSKYEVPENNGISHFLEHMCFKGTTKRPTPQHITHELDALGVQYNAFTGHEYTGYYIKGATKHYEKIVEIISDIYLHSTFPQDELNRERGVILDEINMYEDHPQKKVDDILMQLVYGEQPAGKMILGTRENIRMISQDMIKQYHNEHYVAAGTLVVVAGNMPAAKTVRDIQKAFAPIATSKKHPKPAVDDSQTAPAVRAVFKETDQTHIMLGYRTFKKKHAQSFAASFMATVLGGGMSSRLFDRIRERMGLGYYVYAYNDTYTDHGILKIGVGVANDRVVETVAAIHEECMRLVNEPMTDDELKKVKEYLIGNMYLGLETTDAWADFYGFSEIVKSKLLSPKEREKMIQKMTARQVQKVAKAIFMPSRANVAMIGRFSDADVLSKIISA